MKPNNEMQTIEPCEICIQVKELLSEIVRLKEHVSWLDSEKEFITKANLN